MAIHSHQNKLHAHVVLNKRNIFTNKKLHFNSRSEIKELFNEARDTFAVALMCKGLCYENKKANERNLKLRYEKAKKELEYNLDDNYRVKDKISDNYHSLPKSKSVNLKKKPKS